LASLLKRQGVKAMGVLGASSLFCFERDPHGLSQKHSISKG
jgi:hypothetical protein